MNNHVKILPFYIQQVPFNKSYQLPPPYLLYWLTCIFPWDKTLCPDPKYAASYWILIPG